MHLEVAVQDLLRVHVLQRAAQLLEPAEHGELGEERAIGLAPFNRSFDAAMRGKLHHDVELALRLRAAVVRGEG